MPTADELVADLEAGLAAARQLAAQGSDTSPKMNPVDTSQMPGGVDSAPVNDWIPTVTDPEAATVPSGKLDIIETEALDIIKELKAGTSIGDVAGKLLDENGLKSIVKAIGDLAGKVGL